MQEKICYRDAAASRKQNQMRKPAAGVMEQLREDVREDLGLRSVIDMLRI